MIAAEHRVNGVALVSPEDLVAPVAGEQAGDAALPRHLGAQERTDAGVVSEWLVIGLDQPGQGLQGLLRRHAVDVVLRPEVARGSLRMLELIVAALVKPDGEGVHPLLGDPRHEPEDRTAVGASRQERPGVLGPRAPEGARHRRLRVTHGGAGGCLPRERLLAIRHVPVATDRHLAMADGHQGARLDAPDLRGDRDRRGNVAEIEIAVDGGRVRRRLQVREGAQGPRTRREGDALRGDGVVEAPHADLIHREEKLRRARIPDGDGKRPAQTLDTADPFPLVEGRDHLLSLLAAAGQRGQLVEVHQVLVRGNHQAVGGPRAILAREHGREGARGGQPMRGCAVRGNHPFQPPRLGGPGRIAVEETAEQLHRSRSRTRRTAGASTVSPKCNRFG